MTAAPRVLLLTGDWPVPGVARPPSPARRQAAALRASGMAVEIFVFRGGRSWYNYAVAWTRLRPRVRASRYDLVHAHFAPTGLLALPKRVPLVVTFRRGDLVEGGAGTPPRRLRRILHAAVRLLVRRADAVIVPSEDLRRHLRTHTPVHVIPPELDDAVLSARLLEVYRSVLHPADPPR